MDKTNYGDCSPRHISEIINEIFSSSTPFARSWRRRSAAYPNTELGIDLKLITVTPGRIGIGDCRGGMITRDSDDHYLFIENSSSRSPQPQRSPHVYEGRCINVSRKPDGTLRPALNRPKYSSSFSFKNFCLDAAQELLQVACLGEK